MAVFSQDSSPSVLPAHLHALAASQGSVAAAAAPAAGQYKRNSANPSALLFPARQLTTTSTTPLVSAAAAADACRATWGWGRRRRGTAAAEFATRSPRPLPPESTRLQEHAGRRGV